MPALRVSIAKPGTDIAGKKRKQIKEVSADTPEELTLIWETHLMKLLSPEIPTCVVPSYNPVDPSGIHFRTLLTRMRCLRLFKVLSL